MINIHLFGITTTTGKYLEETFKKNKKKFNLIGYSRKDRNYNCIDLKVDLLSNLSSKKNIFISCSPIWDFASFIEKIYRSKNNVLMKIDAFIICSSSSIITKRFAYNKFDKNLVKNLISSEEKLFLLSKKLGIKCFIVRPTMIYGKINNYLDKNISVITKIMRFLPFIIIPRNTGLRQPIHARELASYIYKISNRIYFKNIENIFKNKIIEIGGDEELTFKSLLFRLKNYYAKNDPIRNCIIYEIPQNIFLLLIFPISLISPKRYESLLRLNSNLSGFNKSSILLDKPLNKFPEGPIY